MAKTKFPQRSDLERLQKLLRHRYGQLLGEVQSLEDGAVLDSTGGEAERQDDEGVLVETQDQDYDVLSQEDDVLVAMSEALQRFEEGTYGRCVDCGTWISLERLEALPYAARCIACAWDALG